MGKACLLFYMVMGHYQASATQQTATSHAAASIWPTELCAVERQAEGERKSPASPEVIARAAWFLGLWFLVSGFHLADVPAAFVSVAAATWASLRLLPPASGRSSVTASAALALRFLQQSIIAGADVAWRALDPRMPLRPGLVTYDLRLPLGPARSAFLTLMSLLPGSLPTWQEDGGKITIHCLDVSRPVAAQMAEEEELFIRALGGDPNND
jgi:multicomponent Na+:H+ antiporter subunit E